VKGHLLLFVQWQKEMAAMHRKRTLFEFIKPAFQPAATTVVHSYLHSRTDTPLKTLMTPSMIRLFFTAIAQMLASSRIARLRIILGFAALLTLTLLVCNTTAMAQTAEQKAKVQEQRAAQKAKAQEAREAQKAKMQEIREAQKAAAQEKREAQRAKAQALSAAMTEKFQKMQQYAPEIEWARAMAQQGAVLTVCDSKASDEARREVEDFLIRNVPDALPISLTLFDQMSDNMSRVAGMLPGGNPNASVDCNDLSQQPALQKSFQGAIDQAAMRKNILMQRLGLVDERCAAIPEWTARLAAEHPELDLMRTDLGVINAQAANLFADGSFEKVFDKPYDELSAQERADIWRDRIRFCLQAPQYKDRLTWESTILPHAFTTKAAELAPAVIANRQARQALPQSISTLENLPEVPESYDQAMAIAAQGNRDFAGLWPSEYRSFTEAVDQARQRLAPALLVARLDRVVGAADDYAGAVELKNALAANQELLEQVDPALRQSQTERVNTKLHVVLEQLLATERVDVDALGTDLPSLASGKQWYQEFNARYATVFADSAIDELLRRFSDNRQRALVATGGELLALIEQADSPNAVQSVTDRYLGVPVDQQTSAGEAVFAAAEARREKLLVATTALENQYAADAEPDIIDTPDIPGDSKRPTAREMYEAVKGQVAAINSSLQSTASACLGGQYKNDPLLAMQCLALCGGSGGTCKVGVTLTRFERLGCAQAAGKAGYMCDYIVGFQTRGATVPPSLEQLLGGGQLTQARFLPRGQGWIIIPEPAP
jgi:hypothetical protein